MLDARNRPAPHAAPAPPTGWRLTLFRVCCGLCLVFAAFYSALDWVVATTRDTRPEIALQALSFDAGANAMLASRMQLAPETADDARLAPIHAAAALARAPAQPLALRAIGFLRLKNEDVSGANRILNYTHLLSRRDLAAELWLGEYAVEQGNTREVLSHFDHALSTSNEIQATLFPVMSSAIVDPRIIDPMADMLARQPWWLHYFLLNASQGKLGPQGAIDRSRAGYMQALGALALFEALTKRGVGVQQQAIDTLKLRIPPDDQSLQSRLRGVIVN